MSAEKIRQAIADAQSMVRSSDGKGALARLETAVAEFPEDLDLRLLDLGRRAPWESVYSDARTIGFYEREGRQLVRIEMTPKRGDKPDVWYVDPEQKVLSGAQIAVADPLDENIISAFWYSDHRRVKGQLLPFRKQQIAGSTTVEWICSSVEVNAEVAPEAVADGAQAVVNHE